MVILAAGKERVKERTNRPTEEQINTMVATLRGNNAKACELEPGELDSADELTMRTRFLAGIKMCGEDQACMRHCRPIRQSMLKKYQPEFFQEESWTVQMNL